jgi:hypothetical protein
VECLSSARGRGGRVRGQLRNQPQGNRHQLHYPPKELRFALQRVPHHPQLWKSVAKIEIPQTWRHPIHKPTHCRRPKEYQGSVREEVLC